MDGGPSISGLSTMAYAPRCPSATDVVIGDPSLDMAEGRKAWGSVTVLARAAADVLWCRSGESAWAHHTLTAVCHLNQASSGLLDWPGSSTLGDRVGTDVVCLG